MLPSLIKRFHAPHAPVQVTSSPQSATYAPRGDALSEAGKRRAMSALTLPVAAPLEPHKRAAAILDIEELREIDPEVTGPGVLATLVLPHMDQGAAAAMVVKHMLERLEGEQLTLFKQSLERQAPGALMNFIFKQCPAWAREELLQHMAHEAPATPTAPYILSDIDNTVCPSRDARFPKSTTSYPGRASLWRALLGSGDVSERTCFLSARFGENVLPWAFVSRRERRVTFENLARVGITNPKVLFGCVWDMPYPTWHGVNMSPLGSKKIKNFQMLRQVFPEYRYVFFGDTCEDDLRVGQAMLQMAPKNVGAIFMHDFGAAGRHWTQQERQQAERLGVIFYQTAAGAALAAYERGLLASGEQDLLQISREAKREFEAIAFATPEQKHAAQMQLERDLAAIAQTLRQQVA